jgi:hypothetical protein
MSQDFLESAFSTKLFDFVLTKKNGCKNQQGLAEVVTFGDWELCYSVVTPFTIHSTSEGVDYFFLGNIFELNSLAPTKSIGHYVGIQYNALSETVRLFRSPNSFLAVYYSAPKKVPLFWGNFSRTKQLVEHAIDSQKIEQFFSHGIISDGATLFRGVQQLGFQKQALVKAELITEESEPTLSSDSPLTLSPSQFLDFTMERFAQWFKYCPYKSVAVSGGADSRLLFATLQKYPIEKEFILHSRCHPQLNPEQDADVVIAKQAADVIGRKHSVQLSQGFPSAYLSQEPPAVPPVLSGLYGGELLGGELLHLVSDARLQKENESSFARAISDCAQMSLCDFYSGAWSLCSSHHSLTLTPYWDSFFIAALLQTPTSVIKNYSLMDKMYEYLPLSLREIQFVSILTHYHTRWEKPLPGINPKSLKGTPIARSLPSSWLRHKELLSDEVYTRRAEALWYYFKGFYGLSNEELLSLL